MHEKCPNTELFRVRIFTEFSPDTGKCGPERTPYLDNFHAVKILPHYQNSRFFRTCANSKKMSGTLRVRISGCILY